MSKIALGENAQIIPNINSINDRPLPSVTMPIMGDYENVLPEIILPNNKIYKLDAVLCEIKNTTITYQDYLSGIINIPQYPNTLDLRTTLYPVRDQGEYGSGVAYATCVMKEWQEANIRDYTKYLSPLFIYINRPNIPKPGMYLSDACDILSNIGTCSSDSFDYNNTDTSLINTLTPTNIPSILKMEANKYRSSNSVLVTSIEQLKYALFFNGPCIFGVKVYGWKHAMWVPWDINNLNYGLKGGHCMTFVGYNNEGFIVRNSWGTDWNAEYWIDKNQENKIIPIGGYDILPYSDFKYVHEIWSTTDLSPFIPLMVPKLAITESNPYISYILCIICIIGIVYYFFFSKNESTVSKPVESSNSYMTYIIGILCIGIIIAYYFFFSNK